MNRGVCEVNEKCPIFETVAKGDSNPGSLDCESGILPLSYRAPRVAHVLLLRPISGNMDVNTLASKCSELIGNAEIVRIRRVVHNHSTCVCLRLPVAAITQKRKLRPVAGFRRCVFKDDLNDTRKVVVLNVHKKCS